MHKEEEEGHTADEEEGHTEEEVHTADEEVQEEGQYEEQM